MTEADLLGDGAPPEVGRSGLRVLELGDDSIAFAGRLLAQAGATIIRIEPAPTPGRLWEGTDLEYLHFNAGKDIRTVPLPGQAGVVHELLAESDVLLTTRSASKLGLLNLTADQLATRYPNLITVTVSGFGADGPRQDWQATDLTACALGGMMAIIGDPDGVPLRPPRQQAYHLAGVQAAIGALLGILARRRVGAGQQVDVSVVEAVASTLELEALAYAYQGRRLGRNGSRYSHVPHTILSTADGYVAGGFGGTARMWTGLVQWLVELDAAEDLTETKWDDPVQRWVAREHIFEVVERAFGSLPTALVAAEATKRGLPWAAVSTAVDVLTDPQLVARQFFCAVTDVATGRTAIDTGPPYRLPWLETPTVVNGTSSPPQSGVTSPMQSEAPSPTPSGAPSNGVGSSTGRSSWASTSDGSAGSDPPVPGALHGLRVLDLTWVLAGPYATKILADNGAEVIKVESVHRPDPTRYSTSMRFSPRPEDGDPDTSGYFANFNRNKRSILLNLKHPLARDVALALVAQCDLLVENFSAGVLERLGLGPDVLHAVQPGLVVLRMSGVGQTGPASSAATFADTLAAMSGMTAETALGDGRPRGITFGLGDMVAAGHGVVAALAALEHRDRTSRGCVIDLSQLECVTSQMGSAFVEVGADADLQAAGCGDGSTWGPGRDRANGPNGHATMAPHGVFPCREPDSWCAVVATSDDAFRSLCRVIGRDDLARDPALASVAGRKAHHERIAGAIEQWTMGQDAQTAMAVLQGAGVASGAVQDGRDLVDVDEQLRHRGFYQVLDHPKLGPILHEGVGIHLETTPGTLRTPAPLLGADTDDVLTALAGIEAAEISELRAAGVLE